MLGRLDQILMRRAGAAFYAAVLAAVLASCTRDLPVEPRLVSSLASVLGPDVEPNNTCSAPQDFGAIALPFSLDGSLDGSPLPGGGDVDFFRFTGTPNSAVRVDLEGQSTGKGTLGDPFLGFFDSGCNLIAINDDNGSTLNSRLAVTIPTDGVFIMAVTRCCDFSFDQGGAGTYQLNIQAILPPSNDDFLNAIAIGALPFSDLVDLTVATTEPGEPTPSCGIAGRTVWYTFTAAETGSIFASSTNAPFSTVFGVYTGSTLATLTEVSCRGGSAVFTAQAGTTYHFLVGGLFDQGGLLEFRLGETPSPAAGFGFNPSDPSAFDVVQFFDVSVDSAGLGFQSQEWAFGDGATGTGCCPTHQFAADADYTVHLTVTTVDGRSASTSQAVSVRTHDVAITRLAAPQAASAGQTRAIVVSIKNKRYPETVEVQLLKSVPGGFQFAGSLTQAAPLRTGDRTTDFTFNYTFTAADARIGKVTFKAIANLVGARDALPADNEAIAAPTKVSGNGGLAGQLLAFANALNPPEDFSFNVYVMRSNGTQQTRLTDLQSYNARPDWSHDGRRIAFSSCRETDGSCEVYVMNADGSAQTKITDNFAFDGEPSWSPDDSKIAFVSDRDGNGEVYIMNADGSDQTRLTFNDASDVQPSWSPGGNKIAFQTDRDGNNEIYVMNSDGSSPVNLTHHSGSDERARWSPGGKNLAFDSIRDGEQAIYVMGSDGSGQTRLTHNPRGDYGPAWSPNANRIAFTRHVDDGFNFDIYVMNPDGSGQQRITSGPGWEADPAWTNTVVN